MPPAGIISSLEAVALSGEAGTGGDAPGKGGPAGSAVAAALPGTTAGGLPGATVPAAGVEGRTVAAGGVIVVTGGTTTAPAEVRTTVALVAL